MSQAWTVFVTFAALGLYAYTIIMEMIRAKGKGAAAAEGSRAKQETLEWLPIYLVGLWLCSLYSGVGIALGMGIAWILGRAMGIFEIKAWAEQRMIGMVIQALATLMLWGYAIVGAIQALIG